MGSSIFQAWPPKHQSWRQWAQQAVLVLQGLNTQNQSMYIRKRPAISHPHWSTRRLWGQTREGMVQESRMRHSLRVLSLWALPSPSASPQVSWEGIYEAEWEVRSPWFQMRVWHLPSILHTSCAPVPHLHLCISDASPGHSNEVCLESPFHG